MRIYTVHFNRLIGEQFVLQHMHLLDGLGFEPPGSSIYVTLSIVSPCLSRTKENSLSTEKRRPESFYCENNFGFFLPRSHWSSLTGVEQGWLWWGAAPLPPPLGGSWRLLRSLSIDAQTERTEQNPEPGPALPGLFSVSETALDSTPSISFVRGQKSQLDRIAGL